MKIYRGAIEILEFTSDGREFRDLDTHEHSLSFNFELDTYVELKKGDRISYNGKNFYLPKDVIVAKNKETDGYRYELTFYDIIKRFDDFIVIFDGNTDFTLNTTGTNHLKLISDNLIDKGIGSFDYSSNSEVKAIHYENLTILEALDLIAETYDLEWWVNGDVLNLGICEFGEPIILEYDKELDDISFSEASERMITRLYVFGGTRNMFYGKRLTLPSDYPYVDLFPNLPSEQIVEGVKIFDDIYPRQENTITEITSSVIYPTDRDHQATTIYTFKCSGINITRDDLLPGESLKMAFTSGQLNGREFELYIRENGYEIIYKQEGDNYFPNPILRPQVGDTFFFFGFKAETIMPELVTNAQNELLSAAQDYMDSLGMDYVFDVKTRSIYCEENNIDLDIGQVVTLESDYLGSITSRIRGYEKDINNVFDATYSIGSYSRYSRISAIEKETGKKVDKDEFIGVRDNVERVSGDIQNMYLTFLSKVAEDSAAEVITFLKGIISQEIARLNKGAQFGEFIPGMFGGKGGKIDGLGNAELTSLRLRALLEAPELRYNRLTVIGDESILTEHGLIESVEQLAERSYRLNMKLEDGEAIAFEAKDLIKGIFHHSGGFATSYMRIEEVGQTFIKVTLANDADVPPLYNLPPQNFMKVARVGNVDNPDRQRYIVMSSKLGGLQIYDGCSDFLNGTLVASFDIAQSFKGKFSNLPLKEGLPYIYAAGLVAEDIIRVDYQGKSVREVYDRGQWQVNVTYYNDDEHGTDDVWHLGCRWRCFSSSTTEEPSWMSAAWTMIEGRSDVRMEFDSSNGYAFFAGQVDTTITPVVLIGNANVSNDIVEEQWSWTRTSGDQTADTIWNLQHVGVRVLELRNEDMGNLWSKTNPVRFTCTAIYPASAINQITNYIEV